MLKIKQLIPEDYCLKCQGCCRFKNTGSAWDACLLVGDIQELLDKNIPPAFISCAKKLIPIPNPQGEGFICTFLDLKDNRCKIYDLRPFECQLYPFLINLRREKVILTLDLNCPYVAANLKSNEFKKYTDYLISFLNSPSQLKLLKENPQIIQVYEEVLDIIELDLPDENK